MSPHLPPDELLFESFTTEDMTRYVPGGYHPVAIGDILGSSESMGRQSQYRIMHKLGFGSYATVWLGQTTEPQGRFVAVKITTAEGSHSKESQLLHEVSQSSHIVTLLDHFSLCGPNGTHSVVVTDVVFPLLSLRSPKRTPQWRKAVAYGLTQGLAQLHAEGIVHGDLHFGNIGLAMPQLAQQDPWDVMQDLGPHELIVVLPLSAVLQTSSLPPYVVVPCDLGKYYQKIAAFDHPVTKIFDLGAAHKAGTRPLRFQCAVEACAPELVFARLAEKTETPPVELPADVWALGATIYEIVTGCTLFHGAGLTNLPDLMCETASSMPPHWQSWRPKSDSSPYQADSWWASRHDELLRGCADWQDMEALVRLLKTMLVLDPAIRPTTAEVLQDPWFYG